MIKYVTIVGMLYWCLACSAWTPPRCSPPPGLLTLAISLGAKDLVADIIAGLFIIFEGEFRVGDIIVGGSARHRHGIGVRTTKIQRRSQHPRHAQLRHLQRGQHDQEHSFAAVEVGIEYGEPRARGEHPLKELPNIRRRLPAIIDGPSTRASRCSRTTRSTSRSSPSAARTARLTNDLNRDQAAVRQVRHLDSVPQVVVNKADGLQAPRMPRSFAVDRQRRAEGRP